MSTQRASMGSHCAWSAVHAITQDDQRLYVWIDTTSAFVLPTRYLPIDVPVNVLLERIEQWRQASASELAPQATIAATPVSGTPSTHWLKTWLKLLLLRPVQAETVPINAAPIALMALVSLGLTLYFDRLSAGPQSEFYTNNISALGLYALFALTIAWVLSRESMPTVPFGKALFVVAGGVPLLIALVYAVMFWATYPWMFAFYSAIALYFLVYGANALRQLCNAKQPKAILAAFAVSLLVVAASMANLWTATLWYPLDEEAAAGKLDPTWNAGEVLLFEQQQRLDRALASIAPAATTPSTYFLGFAGVAEQKVFAEEIGLAAKVVNNRYGTTDRSLRLINDRRDLDSQPLATVTNLHYALQGLAKKMNVDQDILFLALSSHGDDEPSLQVSNGNLSLQQVTGENLAAALRDSGIKWRIIVISACHAGSFIEPLKNPYTLIITAAAADKTSFGCADDRDLTYFGEAFYRDALPNAANLEDAFAQAKAAIAKREQRENIKPSDPQAYFGAEISQKLRQPT